MFKKYKSFKIFLKKISKNSRPAKWGLIKDIRFPVSQNRNCGVILKEEICSYTTMRGFWKKKFHKMAAV